MNVEILKATGINYEDGLKRFASKVPLYEKYLMKFPEDECSFNIKTSMEAKNYEEDFKAAHAFKGVTGNLSLETLYKVVYDFVECLRNNSNIEKAEELFVDVTKEDNRMVDVINSQM